jgi:hypothetical protein
LKNQNPTVMKKPLRFFSFVFFLFAIYLNVFYKEDSFLARVVAGKSEVSKQQTAQQTKEAKPLENEMAENTGK